MLKRNIKEFSNIVFEINFVIGEQYSTLGKDIGFFLFFTPKALSQNLLSDQGLFDPWICRKAYLGLLALLLD